MGYNQIELRNIKYSFTTEIYMEIRQLLDFWSWPIILTFLLLWVIHSLQTNKDEIEKNHEERKQLNHITENEMFHQITYGYPRIQTYTIRNNTKYSSQSTYNQ